MNTKSSTFIIALFATMSITAGKDPLKSNLNELSNQSSSVALQIVESNQEIFFTESNLQNPYNSQQAKGYKFNNTSKRNRLLIETTKNKLVHKR